MKTKRTEGGRGKKNDFGKRKFLEKEGGSTLLLYLQRILVTIGY